MRKENDVRLMALCDGFMEGIKSIMNAHNGVVLAPKCWYGLSVLVLGWVLCGLSTGVYAVSDHDPCLPQRAYKHDNHYVQPYYRSQSCKAPYAMPERVQNVMTGVRQNESQDLGHRQWVHRQHMDALIIQH